MRAPRRRKASSAATIPALASAAFSTAGLAVLRWVPVRVSLRLAVRARAAAARDVGPALAALAAAGALAAVLVAALAGVAALPSALAAFPAGFRAGFPLPYQRHPMRRAGGPPCPPRRPARVCARPAPASPGRSFSNRWFPAFVVFASHN